MEDMEGRGNIGLLITTQFIFLPFQIVRLYIIITEISHLYPCSIVDWGGFGHGVNSDGIRNVGAI